MYQEQLPPQLNEEGKNTKTVVQSSDGNMLISDDDRRLACNILEHALDEGRIDAHMLEQRRSEISKAKTVADINNSLDQLPYQIAAPLKRTFEERKSFNDDIGSDDYYVVLAFVFGFFFLAFILLPFDINLFAEINNLTNEFIRALKDAIT